MAMRIAIVGAGISGIAFAGVLRRFGHECVLFDKAAQVGGIWALTYPQVRLQNSREQYTFIDFPWPEQPDQHPTAAQIIAYIEAAIDHFALDVRLEHTVTSMLDTGEGWTVTVVHDGGEQQLEFDYAIVSIGQYAEQNYRPEFSGKNNFKGNVISERDVESLEVFRDKKVAVVGFGKSAVDMCAFAAPSALSVAHVFRTPRWLVPFHLLGAHYSYLLFARATTFFMPSWVHSGRVERAVHRYLEFFVKGFWRTIGALVRSHIRGHASSTEPMAQERLNRVTPMHSFSEDMRSATAMAPQAYYSMVADGSIEPHQAEVKGFTSSTLVLANNEEIAADVVVLSVGSGTPVFPFLPQIYRDMIESESDGVQLYRHLVHPQIPNLAFAGYNHGFMHIPAAEIGALWLGAALRGDLELPDAATQLQSIDSIRQWKRDHVTFEPSRSCAVSTRFQQYIDALLRELGISPYRKMPNIFAECFVRYGGADYDGIVDRVVDHPPQEPRSVCQFDA
jgi:dimethylaniline monooxygenase (N-oxide forming)